MDPSIMKFLEEDEDESMHSGADVDALQEQLNRDIAGDVHDASSSQPSDSDIVLSQGVTHTTSQTFNQWQKTSQEQNNNLQIQQNLESAQQHNQRSSESDLKQHRTLAVNQQHQKQEISSVSIQQKPLQATPQQGQGKSIPQATGMQVSVKVPISICELNRMPNQESESQYAKLQKMSNQQASGNDQVGNAMTRGKQLPFAVLLPTILQQLDKDKGMQLHTLYTKLKKNEIPKEDFARLMRNIVGNQMLRMAVSKLQSQVRSPLQQIHPRMPSASIGPAPLPMPQPLAQLQQKSSNSPVDAPHIRPSAVQMKTDSIHPTMENSVPQSQEVDRQNSHGMQVSQMPPSSMGVVNHEKAQSSLPIQGLSKQHKKQKIGVAVSDQSIDQLNDVTAVSGVNLREEEEQLFSGPKEDTRASEASRRIVQEEEERLILQKIPLQKKMAEIMAKCGLKRVSKDVERCVSLCVEERLHGLLGNLIRLSKQRVHAEKLRHRTIITSDVREQIMTMNLKAREEWEKKQAAVEKIRKLNEPDNDNGADGDKEKDEGRSKSAKENRDGDEKMRATAANVAARAAVGGDDMLSKWQLMAEQARQKREGGNDSVSDSQPGNDMNNKSILTSSRNTKDNQEVEKRGNTTNGATSGTSRRSGRNPNIVARAISVKDVIAILEREPQMSKSTLLHGLYEKIRSASAVR